MSQSKHTPGPWGLDCGGDIRTRHAAEKGYSSEAICSFKGLYRDDRKHEAPLNASRIVACVNACEGVEDPADLPKALEHYRHEAETWKRNYYLAAKHLPEKVTELRTHLDELHGIVDRLALAYRGHLSHEGSFKDFNSRNIELSAETRTRLAFIEDCVSKADAIACAEEAYITDVKEMDQALREDRCHTRPTLLPCCAEGRKEDA